MSWTALHSNGSFAVKCGEEDTKEGVAVIGLDLANSVFKFTGSMLKAKWCYAGV